MRIFVDIDGTLTTRQCKYWHAGCAIRDDMLAVVQAWAAAGHEIRLWSGSTPYAESFAREFGLPFAAMGKPEIIVDNQRAKWARILARRVITPAAFMELRIGGTR